MGNYSINEHTERFAVWAAAAAVRPPLFVPTNVIMNAINNCGIKKDISATWEGHENAYMELHKNWCNMIIKEIIQVNTKCTYGLAAKIIAIYTKSAFIISNHGEGKLSEVAYPPIDSILLDNLRNFMKTEKIEYSIPESYRWSKLTVDEYFKLIDILKKLMNRFNKSKFWELEEYWILT